MIYIYGTYRLGTRDVAFRSDWCSHCHAEVVALGRESKIWAHFFWIPVWPLGPSVRWHCTQCGQDPAGNDETSRPVRIIAWLLVLAALYVITRIARGNDPELQDGITLAVLISSILGAVFMTWWTFRSLKGGHLERRTGVQPYDSETCPICSGGVVEFYFSGTSECVKCRLQHRPQGWVVGVRT